MNQSESLQLQNLDSEDISDVLPKLERSFGFRFSKGELANTKTFGQLCDIIISRINLEHSDGCTTQQAFYKLRLSIAAVQGLDLIEINTNSELELIFPKTNRRSTIRQLERQLGFKLKILEPKTWIRIFLASIIIGSAVGLFINWKFGLMGIVLSLLVSWIAEKTGKEFAYKTVRDVAKKMAREHYLASRRNPATINRQEIVVKIKELFSHDLDLDPMVLTREAFFR